MLILKLDGADRRPGQDAAEVAVGRFQTLDILVKDAGVMLSGPIPVPTPGSGRACPPPNGSMYAVHAVLLTCRGALPGSEGAAVQMSRPRPRALCSGHQDRDHCLLRGVAAGDDGAGVRVTRPERVAVDEIYAPARPDPLTPAAAVTADRPHRSTAPFPGA